MSVRILAPALGVAATLILAACAGTGSYQTGAASAMGAGSNLSPALGAAYGAAPATCSGNFSDADDRTCNLTNSARIAGLASNNGPALGAVFDPHMSGCTTPGTDDCLYANAIEEILPGSSADGKLRQASGRQSMPRQVDTPASNNGPALGSLYDTERNACETPGTSDCPYANDVQIVLAGGATASSEAKQDGASGKNDARKSATGEQLIQSGGKSALPSNPVFEDGINELDSISDLQSNQYQDEPNISGLEMAGHSSAAIAATQRPTTMVAGCTAINRGDNAPPSASIVILADGGGHLYCGVQYIGELSPHFFSSPVEMMAIGYKPTTVAAMAQIPPVPNSHSAKSPTDAGLSEDRAHADQVGNHDNLSVASDRRVFESIASGSQLTIYLQNG